MSHASFYFVSFLPAASSCLSPEARSVAPGWRKQPRGEGGRLMTKRPFPFDWLFLELHVDPGGTDRQINALRGRVDDHLHTVLVLHGDAGVTAGQSDIRAGRGVIA